MFYFYLYFCRNEAILRRKRNKNSKELDLLGFCSKEKNHCSLNEYCDLSNMEVESGICRCKAGYKRNEGVCIKLKNTSHVTSSKIYSQNITSNSEINITTQSDKPAVESSISNSLSRNSSLNLTESSLVTSSTPFSPTHKVIKKLIVQINNKTVFLKEGSSVFEGWVSLSAYALGGKYYFCVLSYY